MYYYQGGGVLRTAGAKIESVWLARIMAARRGTHGLAGGRSRLLGLSVMSAPPAAAPMATCGRITAQLGCSWRRLLAWH